MITVSKPSKILCNATFIGRALWGTLDGRNVTTSRIIHRWTQMIFETENTLYVVEFLPGAEITIPDEWKIYPSK